ncbi:hypothetical protein KCU61_g5001, partial [Aureobasidium melanogenum]
MPSWTRQAILQLYRHQFPDRGDARIITDNEAGTWTMWICYDDGFQDYFSYDMNSEQEALGNVLGTLRKDEDDDPDDSESYDDSEDSDDSEDEESEDEEQSDDENLHDSDSEDPDDQDRFYLSDDEEDFDPRNNHGNPHCWDESDDSCGFSNGVGQVGSHKRCW